MVRSVTLAGDTEVLEQLAKELAADQVFAKFLKVPIPYHSPVMDRIREELLSSLADIEPHVRQAAAAIGGALSGTSGNEVGR